MKHNWEYKKLGEVCKIIGGSTPKTNIPSYWNGSHPWITPAELDGSKYIERTERYLTDDALAHTNLQLLPIGTVLLSSRAPIGKLAITKIPMYCNQGFKNVVVGNKLISEFVYWYLTFKRDYIVSLGRGATFKEISKSITEQIPIPLPPLPIQQKIVAELDKVCLIIDKKKQQLKELDKLAQAIFYDMFGDPVENEKGWDTCMLGDMCEIGSSKRIFAEEYTETGIPFYRGKEVSEKSKGQPTSIELYISSNRYAEIKDKYGVPKIGDILLTAVGTIGNIWVVDSDEPFYFKDGNVLWLQKKTEASSVYLKYLLEDLIEVYKKSMANGCAYNALTIMNLKKMPISIIPLSLQQSFATKIEAIEKQKELISRSIKEAQTLFDERMDYWFD